MRPSVLLKVEAFTGAKRCPVSLRWVPVLPLKNHATFIWMAKPKCFHSTGQKAGNSRRGVHKDHFAFLPPGRVLACLGEAAGLTTKADAPMFGCQPTYTKHPPKSAPVRFATAQFAGIS